MRSLLGLEKGDELIAKSVDNKIILEPLKYGSLSELFAAVKADRYISEKEIRKIVKNKIINTGQSH
jgi:bifunctional DNA-binding transcriptional regulator/antitoxin component of YhaV-PrlF toxin-antitoxin module